MVASTSVAKQDEPRALGKWRHPNSESEIWIYIRQWMMRLTPCDQHSAIYRNIHTYHRGSMYKNSAIEAFNRFESDNTLTTDIPARHICQVGHLCKFSREIDRDMLASHLALQMTSSITCIRLISTAREARCKEYIYRKSEFPPKLR